MLSAYLNMPHTNQNLVNYAKTRIQTYSYRDENNQEYCMELRDVIEKTNAISQYMHITVRMRRAEVLENFWKTKDMIMTECMLRMSI